MKKIVFTLAASFILFTWVFAQESLKSIEEEYYDFLSLRGITERPTLGYRTLSDSVWHFNDITDFLENEDGTFTRTIIPGYENPLNVWKNINLGRTDLIIEPEVPVNNFFTRGIKQGLFVRLYG